MRVGGRQDNELDEAEDVEPDADGDGLDVVAPGAPGPKAAQPAKARITTRYLTKYERARLLGTRALQIRYACEQRSGPSPPSRH